MEIKRLVFNPFRENTYVAWDDTKECVVVDAGNMVAGENRILKEFIEAVRTGRRPAIDAEAGFANVRTAQRIVEAIKRTM
jgi:glyoxylase-like metal-dependent hydrolase (beta-lactamase superfamily II)